MNVRSNPYLADALHDQHKADELEASSLTRSADADRIPFCSSGSRRRILIADDSLSGAQTLAAILQCDGHDTCIAQDGLEALQALESYGPDAVFLNIALPYVDGYETCKHLRRQPAGQHLLIIALTGWNLPRNLQRSTLAGFDYQVTKPYDAALLQRLLAKQN